MLWPNSLLINIFHERTMAGILAFVGADAHIGPSPSAQLTESKWFTTVERRSIQPTVWAIRLPMGRIAHFVTKWHPSPLQITKEVHYE